VIFEFNPTKPGDLLLFIGIPGQIVPLRGISSLRTEFSPTEYVRRYFDESEETAELTGTFPTLDCEIDLFSGDPAHEYLLNLIKRGATGKDAATELYLVDCSGGSPPFPCLRRDYSFIPGTFRTVSGDVGTPAYTLICSFKARGLPERGSAVIAPGGMSLEYSGDAVS